VFPDVDTRVRGSGGESPDPARRLKCPVPRVQQGSRVALGEASGGLVDPLGVEPVRTQCLILRSKLSALLLVRGQSEAADAP
jgi:hypothetical protein